MNIGFDLDGVIFGQDQGVFSLIHQLPTVEQKLKVYRYYCSQRPLNFNPCDFLGSDDKGFFITARGDDVADITRSWQQHYFPQFTLILTGTYKITDVYRGQNLAVPAKYKAIMDNNIEVFFEDSPEIVEKLRQNLENCKVIHYGGRVL